MLDPRNIDRIDVPHERSRESASTLPLAADPARAVAAAVAGAGVALAGPLARIARAAATAEYDDGLGGDPRERRRAGGG